MAAPGLPGALNGADLQFGGPDLDLDNLLVPFRTGLPGATPFGAPAPTPNLFSSIVLPEPSSAGAAAGGEGDSAGSQGGGARGGGLAAAGGRGGKASDQRQSAIQEKNRRAQKRFRERQKAKMKDMGEQLDEMSGELSKLRVENNGLKNRNSILEKVLALRDEHIRVLQDEQQVFDLGQHYLQASSQKLLPAPAGGSSASLMLTAGPGGALVGGGPVGAMTTSEIKAVKSMPAELIINRWKDTVRELGNILVQIEGSPDRAGRGYQEATEALCRVLDQAGQLCMHTAVLHPTNMQRLIAATLDDGRSGASAEDRGRWAAVTASLQLTEEQKSQVLSLRGIFLRRMARVLQKLQGVSIPDRMLALQSVIAETLRVNECTSELKANLQEEHLAGMEFIGTVFKTIFSPLQKARAIVQSYPFYPDVYQISTVLAVEKEGPSALEGIAGAATEAQQQQQAAAGLAGFGGMHVPGGTVAVASLAIPTAMRQ
eukprot:scaffold20.g7855.t1